jgi:hypothetical protein
VRKRKLPIGVTESKTEPWFRYSRGQLTTPKFFYYGNGSSYRYWWARWPGCPSGIKFSILEHKNQKAFALARIARELESQDRAAIEREYRAQLKSRKSKSAQ